MYSGTGRPTWSWAWTTVQKSREAAASARLFALYNLNPDLVRALDKRIVGYLDPVAAHAFERLGQVAHRKCDVIDRAALARYQFAASLPLLRIRLPGDLVRIDDDIHLVGHQRHRGSH